MFNKERLMSSFKTAIITYAAALLFLASVVFFVWAITVGPVWLGAIAFLVAGFLMVWSMVY
jgi:hypothetical protein